MAPSTDRPRQRRAQHPGFTLVELLVTILIGGFVTTGLAALLSAEFRSSSAILSYQRQSKHASQARRFIESEAARASRLQQVTANSLRLFGVHPGSTSQYTITYDVVAVSAVNTNTTTFRGPFVLRRVGPPYAADGTFPPATNQTSVILDGLNSATAFTVNANDSSLGAAVTLTMDNAGSGYQPDFFVTVATSPALSVLQQPKDDFEKTENCGTGCRNTGTTQEWDTRPLTDPNPFTITPVGSPAEVIVYFNANKPTTISPCIRSSCKVVVTVDNVPREYQINTRVDRLVFLDTVVGVPAN